MKVWGKKGIAHHREKIKRMYDLFNKIILLTRDELSSTVDKQAFKHAGFKQVFTQNSGIELALELADVHINRLERDTLVFCQRNFSDISALEFIKLIRKHPFLLHQPLVFIASNKEESAEYLKHGFTATLTRPFTSIELEETIRYCKWFENVRREKLLEFIHTKGITPSSKAFYALLEDFRLSQDIRPERVNPETALHDGLELIRRGQKQKAIALLNKATNNSISAARAHEELARISKEDNDKKGQIKHLEDAIRYYAYNDENIRMSELALEYDELVEYPMHPLAKDISKYIRENRLYDFVKKLETLENLFPAAKEMTAIVNACLATENPQEIARHFNSYFTQANYTFGDALQNIVNKRHKERISSREAAKKTELIREKKKAEELSESIREQQAESKKIILKTVDVDALPDFGSNLDKIPQIPLIDESTEKVYLKNSKKNLVWNVIKGTAHVYKNMKDK